MVALDRIRLTGLLRKEPRKRGSFYGPDRRRVVRLGSAPVVVDDDVTVVGGKFAPCRERDAAANSVRSPWRASRGTQLALEAVEQIEKANALPRAVSASDGRLPEHTCRLEAENRLACALLGTPE